MFLKKVLICFFISICELCVAGPATDTLEFIITKNTEAMGGKKNLENIRSMVTIRSHKMITLMLKKPIVGNAILLIDTAKWQIAFAEGSNNKYYWEQWDADSARRIVKGRPDTAMWQTKQRPSNLFLPLYQTRSRGHQLNYIGRELVESINYYKVLLTLSNGYTTLFYINPQTFLIERNRDYRRHHAFEKKIRNIETIWRDFRKVNGVTISFLEVERDLDTGEVLSRSKPILDIFINKPVDVADVSLEGNPDKWINFLKSYLNK